MSLKVEVIPVGPLVVNALVLWDEESKAATIVDPGAEADRIAAAARILNLEVKEILSTHAHVDHAGAVTELKQTLGVPFALHRGDEPLLSHLGTQARMFGLPNVAPPAVERWLAEGDEVQVGSHRGQVLHTPGHTPGGCSFFFAEAKVLVAGDTLFQGSVGRSDLPGGSHEQLIESIKEKLLPLGDDVVVFCGHGPRTNLGMERQYNPFLR